MKGWTWRGIVALALVMLPVRVNAGGSTANDLQTARSLFAQAEKDEDAEDWAAALEKLRRAAQVKRTPGLEFHIALCEEKLGQLTAALADYTLAEADARAEHNKEVLAAVADSLASLRGRVPKVSIHIPPGLVGLDIAIDGKPLSKESWGTAVPVDVGPHRVEATANERVPFASTISVNERDNLVIDIVLPIVPKPKQPSSSPPLETGPTPSSNRVGFAIALSAGAIALTGAGLGAFLIASSEQEDARTVCAKLVSCTDQKSPVRTWDAIALGAWLSAAGAAVGAIVLWTLPDKRERTTTRVMAIPGGLQLERSF